MISSLIRIVSFVALSTAAMVAQSGLWSGPRPHGPLAPFVLDMVGTPDGSQPSDGKSITFHDTLEKVDWHGHNALKRVAATTQPGETEFVRWSAVIFDEKTLLPYYSEWRRSDGLFLRREYDGLHVKESRTPGAFTQAPPVEPGTKLEITNAEFDLTEPALAWVEGVGLPVLLALPLREGFEGSVPVISGDKSSIVPCSAGPCFVTRMSYRVEGEETITGISKHAVKTWKISVPESKFVFWISKDHPRLERVTWPGVGGMFTMGPREGE